MKKSIRRFLAMLSCVVMLMTSVASAFTDLPSSHWAYDNINKMYNGEIIAGFEDGTFRPDDLVTREQFITIFVKALNIEPLEVVYEFEDVEDNRWSKPYIDMAFAYLPFETIDGKNYFRPAETVTREDVAYALTAPSGVPDYTALDRFIDKDEISEDKKWKVAVAVEQGLMNGNPDGTFKPKKGLTRAELATVICNAAKLANIEIDFPKFNGDILDLGKDWNKYKFAYSNKDKIVDVDEWGWYTASTRYLKEKESPNGDLTIGWAPETKYLDIMTLDNEFVKKVKLPESDYVPTDVLITSNTDKILTEDTQLIFTLKGTEKVSDIRIKMTYKDANGKEYVWARINKEFIDNKITISMKEVLSNITNSLENKEIYISVDLAKESGGRIQIGYDGYRVELKRNKEEKLPEFKYLIDEGLYGCVDLTWDYSKYEYSYSMNDKPGNWYKPIGKNIYLESQSASEEVKSISKFAVNAFVRYIGDEENYVTVPLKHPTPKLKIDYEDECIHLGEGEYGYYFIYDNGEKEIVVPDNVEPYQNSYMIYVTYDKKFNGGYTASNKIDLSAAFDFMREDEKNKVEVHVWQLSDFSKVYPSISQTIYINGYRIKEKSGV